MTDLSTPRRLTGGTMVRGPGLIGREREVAEVGDLLRDRGIRLVTLIGPGGVGKTRLAEVVAACAAARGCRVAVVPLAAVGEVEGVLPTIASALRVAPPPDVPLFEAVTAAIGDGDDLLLLLDNLEHLPGVATVVADLCAAVPTLTVLATSRSRLRLRLERVVEVPPLAVPAEDEQGDPVALARVAAVDLFARRVREILPGFAVTPGNAAAVAAICRRLDGVPLAIELVASRGRSLTPVEMLARLERQLPLPVIAKGDTPARQRSMDASIAWSCALLPAAVRARFWRLAVFPGSFDLDAARAVAGVGEPDLEALLDHHLIRRESSGDEAPRFRLLEPVKQYGVDRLRETGTEGETRDRHAAHLRDVVVTLQPRYTSEEESDALATLERYLDDVYAALAWTTADGDGRVAAEIAVALGHPWVLSIPWATSYRWVSAVLTAARAGAQIGDAEMARLLHVAALTAYHAERLDESDALIEEAVTVARRSSDQATLAKALSFRGQTLRARGNVAEAEAVFQEVLALAAAIGDLDVSLPAWIGAGTAALFKADLDNADRLFRAALAAARAKRYRTQEANVLHFLGYVAALRGDFGRGRAAFLEARALQAGAENTHALGTIWGMARLELLAGGAAEAARWLSSLLSRLVDRGETTRTRDGLLDMARLALLVSRPEVAARFFGAVDSESAPIERNRLMAPLWRAAEAATREQLGEAVFRSAYRQGQLLSLDQAVAECLRFTRQVVERNEQFACGEDGALLTARELDVLRLIVAGRSDREIGASLYISHQTASKHVKNILRKLGVSSRTGAATLAVRRGLVTPGS